LKTIKALFFDAGGTLIHLDARYICEAIKTRIDAELAVERFRHAQSLAMAHVAELVADGNGSTERMKRQLYSVLLPEIGVPEKDLDTAVRICLELAEREMLWRNSNDSTAPALGKLKESGMILGVVSNSDGRIEQAFEQTGLKKYFDFFVDSYIVGVEKPDPRIFDFALERAGVAPEEAAYVGDLFHIDVVAARKAGLTPILYDPYDLHSSADCMRIRDISDLVAVINT
jgi:HAD superfamily hydrolase (TIGR01549 family)